ncbi:uncharacterized protein LOC122502146 [Leptopilina heterotoma]|uniref:uncharacterized protein LOC122502146 n=1 Tax=Leptopilina heterotoma TaxID=63436 RepID=UPI001CA85142|nr:uncharacterized protein LOC122502146 [Leptopilina heterotoma]
MISITIICILISLASGKNIDRMSLMDLTNSLLQMEETMRKLDISEDSAIFLGNTKAGRSTLINYIIGNTLKAEKKSRFDPVVIVKADEKSKGPIIGDGPTSVTTTPTKWYSRNLPNLALWDTPGFEDNRGSIQDITNAFSIFTLVKSVKSLKIILVIDIKDITEDNTQQFLSLLTSIENLFGNNFTHFFPSTTVIFTKVARNIGGNPIDYEYVNYHLESHFLSDTNLRWSEIAKNFTHYLIKNTKRVALFRKMMKTGYVTKDEVDVGIFEAINSSTKTEANLLQTVRPSISPSSMISLYQSQEELVLEEGITEIASILSLKANKTEETLNYLENRRELEKITKELQPIEMALEETLTIKNDLRKKMNSLINSYDNIKAGIDHTKLLKNAQLIKSTEDKLYVNISKHLEFSIDAIAFSMKLKMRTLNSIATMKLDGKNDTSNATIIVTPEERNICLEILTEFTKVIDEDNDSFLYKIKTFFFSFYYGIKLTINCGN